MDEENALQALKSQVVSRTSRMYDYLQKKNKKKKKKKQKKKLQHIDRIEVAKKDFQSIIMSTE